VKGLIIDMPWIELILSGDKTWEMRKTACHHRGPIALIRKGSGQVVGSAEIIDSLPSIEERSDYAKAEPWHCIPPNRQTEAFSDGWRTPWVLRNAQPLANPIAYRHPNGAVIWVNLDDDVRRAVVARSRQSMNEQGPLVVRSPKDESDRLPAQADTSHPQGDAVESPKHKNNVSTALHALVRRGKAAGTVLSPHVHTDGCYVVSVSRYEKDYIRIRAIDELKEYLRRGYSLRMSNEATHRAPSLIAPASIIGWR
jgi:hypothetical protein